MILCDSGINWNWFYECELVGNELIIWKSYRIHKYNGDATPEVDGHIVYWHDGNGASGYGITNTHVTLYDGRTFEYIKED